MEFCKTYNDVGSCGSPLTRIKSLLSYVVQTKPVVVSLCMQGVTEVEAANAALKQETSQLREDMEKIADGIRSLMESVKKLTEKMEGLAH